MAEGTQLPDPSICNSLMAQLARGLNFGTAMDHILSH